MTKKRLVWLFMVSLALAVLLVVSTGNARAQTSDFRVNIIRPGEGETVYVPSSAPYARVPVAGHRHRSFVDHDT